MEYIKILIKYPAVFERFQDIYNGCKGSTADHIAKLDWLKLNKSAKEAKLMKEPKKKKSAIKRVASSVKNAGQTYQTKIGIEDKWDDVMHVIKKLSHIIHHIDNKYYSFSKAFKRVFSLKENVRTGRTADLMFCGLFSSQKARNIGKPGD